MRSEVGENSKTNLVLDGKKVIVESCACFDGSTSPATIYRKDVIYTFPNKAKAKEYYTRNINK